MSWLGEQGVGQDCFIEPKPGQPLCYRRLGDPQAEAVLLLAGLAQQLISWPDSLVQGLLRAGYQVLLLDNRDVGRSFRAVGAPPSQWHKVLGVAPGNSYQLEDMAADAYQLLDHLQVPRAHLLGVSMGGMIAQCMAAQAPERVASLTSVFSTTGASKVGKPAFSTLLRLARSAPRSLAEAQARHVGMMRHIGDAKVPGILEDWAQYSRAAWARNGFNANAGGVGRQIGAIFRSADRTAQLAKITAPTLVLHGERDLMVHPSGGVATAAAVAGARLVLLPHLRHQLDVQRTPEVLEHLLPHLQRRRG